MSESNKSTQATFYELLFILCYAEEDRNRILPNLGLSFESTFFSYQDIEYPLIYQMVSNSSISNEENDIILQILVEIENQVAHEEHKKMLRKMRRHFSLSYEQKANFDRLNKEFSENLLKSEETLMNVQLRLEEASEKLEDTQLMIETIDNESSKIYAQFVTILGIFTAIVISVFGGLSIVNGVFEKIDGTPMWKIVLTGSMVSTLVLCLLFLLTRWISTIINKAFGYENERSFMQIVTNNGAFATGIFMFSYLILAGVAFSSVEVSMKLKEILSFGDNVFIILLLVIPVVMGMGIFVKTVFSSQESET